MINEGVKAKEARSPVRVAGKTGKQGSSKEQTRHDRDAEIFYNKSTDRPAFQFTNSRLRSRLLREQESAGEDIYECSSRDSLQSLQQLVETDHLVPALDSSLLREKYLFGDSSSYGEVSREGPARSFTRDTNFLKSKMSYTGYQISGYKKYQVSVELQTVDFPVGQRRDSQVLQPHMTGFLTIKGLTNNHPEISTFFDCYAVTSNKFGFLSSSWGDTPIAQCFAASEQTDMVHWLNFPAFKQLEMANRDKQVNYVPDYLNHRYIFMRWKEKFLVPDPFVNSVEGASYDGFYYIVHDQYTGNIQGFYYHEDAEKFQQLELVPCPHTPGNSNFAMA
ncbi:glucose-induced degradation complex subunit VID24 KNAG_0B01550 [Huiozyma naganishii CBS 8797]|uniref:Vacuolar import and degradation protein n=1 Tax=Huiozyma naganishii (strain ATCC MYA-139 / BCRC 22969 / CBS 8797 / KCTC 17520 / NBRC 10181 / NCYC 3082 / Yp74L-3) TaxID=1071383 RepID=J7RUR9_HUIN7|nr:hypothetical protein KNAG_0B01550 [Kazachstania naganishii CBS 8797]CCK68602.1 hypothetical protein KNAG_0B01550 [Kazachstania naganishii CBS 8797]